MLRGLRVACFLYVTLLWMFLTFVCGVIALCFTPRSGRAGHFFLRIWGRGMLAIAGVRLRVEGTEHLDPSEVRVLVANHASYLDPPAAVAGLPLQVRFVLKQELMRMPFVGWYASLGGHFLLDRGNPREGKRVLDRAVERVRAHGLCPLVFPEGTRSADGRLAPFRTGAFQLALAAGAPVQPVAILGSHDVMPRDAAAPRRAGEIVLRIAPPIPVEGLKGGPGRRVLGARVREALVDLGVPDA